MSITSVKIYHCSRHEDGMSMHTMACYPRGPHCEQTHVTDFHIQNCKTEKYHMVLSGRVGDILAIKEDGSILYKGRLIQGPDVDTAAAAQEIRNIFRPKNS